jgi:hypothetical protein
MKSAILAIVMLGLSAAASAQQQEGPPLAPGELQSLFDGYAVVEAQKFVGLDDTQFAAFLPKYRALQENRRRNLQQRMRLIQELNRMTNARAGELAETELRDRLRALYELEDRTAADLRKAREAIDQTLNLRQQARFRVFEEQMEQRKLQLLMRARQAARGQRPRAQ